MQGKAGNKPKQKFAAAMAHELIIRPEALEDIDQAYGWYKRRQAGLGERFLRHLDDCLSAICRSPNAHAIVYAHYRRAVVRRFPYVVFYEVEGERVNVYSIFHTSQKPRKWMDRLP